MVFVIGLAHGLFVLFSAALGSRAIVVVATIISTAVAVTT